MVERVIWDAEQVVETYLADASWDEAKNKDYKKAYGDLLEAYLIANNDRQELLKIILKYQDKVK